MLARIFAFEVRYQLRQPVFWITGAAFFLLAFLAITTDVVTIGGSIGNVHRNAPYVIMQILLVLTAIGTFATTAFVAGSVHRDFEYQTDALFFSLPVRKSDYLLGRFFGSLLIATLIFAGVALAIVAGSAMPWLEPVRVGPFRLAPYLFSFAVFVVPNLFLTGSIFFSLATLTRSLLSTYAGVVVFFVAWGVAGVLLRDLEQREIGALIDPYGFSAFGHATQYWTTIERNTGDLALAGPLLYNRLIWVGLGVAVLAFTLVRFRRAAVETRRARRRRQQAEALDAAAAAGRSAAPAPLPRVAPAKSGSGVSWRQFLHQARLEVRGGLRGIPFLIMLFFGMFNLAASSTVFGEMFGTPVYPVTNLMLRIIEGAFGLFVFLILLVYSGEMVWRDRAVRVHEMVDAMPVPTWVMWSSRLAALAVLLFTLLVAAMATGVGIQLFHGFPNFEFGLYLKGLFLAAAPAYMFVAALCLFLQVVLNQKYVAWLLAAVVYITGQVLPALRLEHHLYRFGTAPSSVYSDMNGYGHFVAPTAWFYLYWGLVCAAMVVTAHLLWVRGTETSRALRLREARRRLRGPAAAALGVALAGVAATGAWIFYNTNILNEYRPTKTALDMQADYEKKYKQHESTPLPRIVDVKADVDIFPERRAADIRGRYLLRNKTASPIDVLHLALNPDVTIRRLEIPGGTIESEDKEHGYRIWRLAPPLAPGADMTVSFDLGVANRGFVNEGVSSEIVANGTFFNNIAFFPHVGYSRFRQLEDPNERRRRDLPPVQRFPKIDDEAARMSNYLSSEADWVSFETTVSTSPDQIALAPGYLRREWTENGRRYFHYTMETTKIFNFFAYLSARYAVERDRWNDVAIEVYYHPAHRYNVARMIDAVKKSLAYFTENFGPYQHRQVRIVEFPAYATFAQSFPNTIPFSESIGFIARLDDKPDAIDYVFYVTAHEVAHQWWAHQVMGGNVQGATLLSETMSQYSALMVMEKEYGPDKMRRFLKYELDSYLRGRGAERVEEMPLYLVENQPYIHYRKGSLVMYALKDQVGEEPLNRALAAYVRRVAFQEPPYTTTLEFLEAVKAAVPPDREALLEDLFRTITLYENKATKATWSRREDGKYVVALEVASSKFRADGQGKETPVALDDWIDIGVFGATAEGAPPEGAVLALERRHIVESGGTIEIVVDQEPRKAGIDPFNKLVDRVPDNNIVAVSAVAAD